MDDRPLKLISASTAVAAAPGFQPQGDGAAAPAPGQSPLAYLDALAGSGYLADAGGFLAAALPYREAVWWACRCVRSVLGPVLEPDAEKALQAAETWAAAPGDINRRKTLPAAEAVGVGHPAGCAALAAFLAGGSLAPVGLKDVPPPPGASARAVAGAVLLAAARTVPASKIPETHRQFLTLGLAVARGEDRWVSPT